jgi:hypothetical protein
MYEWDAKLLDFFFLGRAYIFYDPLSRLIYDTINVPNIWERCLTPT